MPARLPTHKPPRPLRDVRIQEQDRARHAARHLPYRGKQWQSIRRAQLERFPLCNHCGDPANEVDHIEGDTSQNIVGVSLQSLCKPCHSSKTGRERARKSLRPHGWNTDANPSHAQPRIART